MNELPRNFDKKELYIPTFPQNMKNIIKSTIYQNSVILVQKYIDLDMYRNVIYDEIVITNNLGKMDYIISCIAGSLSEFTISQDI